MKNRISILLILIIILIVGCSKNEIYYQYQTIPSGKWNKDSVLLFNFRIEHPAEPHDMFVHIRHHSNYPYQNMWLFLEMKQPDKQISSDTIEFYLADDFGKWLGNGVGALKEMPVYFRQQVVFPDTGNYILSIKHGMRDSVLTGINDVGLRIEKITK